MGEFPNVKFKFLGKEACLLIVFIPGVSGAEQGTEESLSKHSSISWRLLEGRVCIPFHAFLITKTFALFLKSVIVRCIFLCSSKLKLVATIFLSQTHL